MIPVNGLSDEKGQTVIEYLLIIGIVIISIALVIRSEFSKTVETAAGKISVAITSELTLP